MRPRACLGIDPRQPLATSRAVMDPALQEMLKTMPDPELAQLLVERNTK